MKKIFLVGCLSLLSVLSAFSQSLGSQSNPLTISTLEEFKEFRNAVNDNGTYKGVPMQQGNYTGGAGLYFVLTADIDMGGVQNADGSWGGATWTPIGTEEYPFRGNFNGKGHKISNLFINNPGSDYQGLFGYVQYSNGGSISLDSIVVESGSITGQQYVGGIVGYIWGSSSRPCFMTGCINKASIKGINYVGGIGGYGYVYVNATNCLNAATLTGTSYLGGVFGRAYSNVTITSCFSVGYIYATSEFIGGLAGDIRSSKISGSVNASNIVVNNESASKIGGLGGYVATNTEIKESINIGAVVCPQIALVGALSGSLEAGSKLQSCYYDKQLLSQLGQGNGKGSSDVIGQAEGRLTTALLGLNTFVDVDNWSLTDGLYPIPKGLEQNMEAIVAATPALLHESDHANSISRAFSVGVDNNVQWSSKAGKLDIGAAGDVSLLELGADTLVAGYDGKAVKEVIVNIAVLAEPGSELNPLLISTEEELIAFRNAINNPAQYQYKNTTLVDGGAGLHFMIANYITLTQPWTPVGTSTNPFKGNLDGGNYIIDNPVVNNPTQDNQGFFGVVDGATIQNLRLRDAVVSGKNNVGGFAGQVKNTTISNCYVRANVHGTENVGGMIGRAETSSLEQFLITGRHSGTTSVGGICGYASDTRIQKSLASGCVTGTTAVGGIVGKAANGAEIRYTTSYTFVAGTNSAGGICGDGGNAILTECVSGSSTTTNGISGTTGVTVSKCYFDSKLCSGSTGDVNGRITQDLLGTALAADLSAENFVFQSGLYPIPAGLENTQFATAAASPVLITAASDNAASISEPFDVCVDNSVSWQSATGKVDIGSDGTTALLQSGIDTLFTISGGEKYKLIVINIGAGFATPGSENNPLFIASKDELLQFRDAVNNGGTYKNVAGTDGFSGKYIALKANDIDLSDAIWFPIGTNTAPFKGTFNGNNFEINGLVTDESSNNQGFFGYLDGATVESLHIGSGTVKGAENVAAICANANNSTIIRYCTNNASVSGNKTVAGICALNNATVSNCINTGFIKPVSSTVENVGGIVGQNNGTVQYCMNAGLIGASQGGGIAGTNANGASIASCLNVVPVTAPAAAIVYVNSGTIQECYYDSQMCAQQGTSTGDNNTTPRQTIQLVGTNVFDDTNWTRRSGLYPVPMGTETSNAASAAAAAVFLSNNETVSGIETIFSAAVENSVIWKGVSGSVDAGVDGNFSLLKTGKDTIQATINDKVYKQVAIEVTAVPELGSEENPLLISSLAEFRNFATAINSKTTYKTVDFSDGGVGKYILLTADMEVGPWTAIGSKSSPFKGNFDGAFHKLTNINVNATTQNQGLFGYINDGAVLENISLNSGTVVGIDNVGGILGYAKNAVVRNCTNGANVQGSLVNIGGIAGYMYKTELVSCANSGDITAPSAYSVGGVVGYMEENSTVEYCMNAGNLWGMESVGGLVGSVANGSNLNKSINVGTVQGTSSVGAVYGFLGASNYSDCYADNQMCMVPAADGVFKPTIDLLNTQPFNDAVNWEQAADLYPRPKPVANTDVAAVAAMPIRFQSTENVDSVVTQVQFTSDLDVAWENTVAVPNFIFDKASNVGVTDCGAAINTATMTATKNDAVRTVNLRILKASSDTVFYTDTVCQRITPNTYSRYGFTQNVRDLPVGVNVFSRIGGANVVGCDSVYALKLTVWPIDTVYYTASIRESSVYTKDGYTYKGSDLQLGDNAVFYEEKESTDRLTRDKVTAFHIRVLNDSLVTRCDNEFPYDFAYTYNGTAQKQKNITLEAAQQPIDLLCGNVATYKDPAFGVPTAVAVYDSILTVVHQINPAYEPASILYDTICSNETYHWRGREFNQTGVYTDTLQTVGCGCDSVLVLDLTVHPSYYVKDYKDVKRRDMPLIYRDPNGVNEPIKFGIDTTQSGVHLIPWQTALGCDSIVELHLTIAENVYDTVESVIACGSYTWFGQTYYQSGIVTHRVQEATPEGCDSIYVLDLTVQTSTTIEEQAQIALGDTYTWRDGKTYSQSGIYEYRLYTEYGCDSIIYKLNLYVLPTQTISETVTICDSELPYAFGDTIFDVGTVSGIYTNVYKIYDGDVLPSKVTLQLTVNKGPEVGQIGQISVVDINTPIVLPEVPSVSNSENLKYQRWEISGDDFATVVVYNGQKIDESYNGWQLRFAAENDCGVGYSNAVMVYVNGYEPPRIVKMWDDVIVCDNSEKRYGQYQWYRDGEILPGATKQYYVEPGGLSGSYHVSVFDSQLGIRRNSEVLTFEKAETAAEQKVVIYPNPSSAAEPMVLKLTGFTDEELQQAKLYVYNVVGELIYKADNVVEQQELRLPAGQYVSSLLFENGKRINTKVVVIK